MGGAMYQLMKATPIAEEGDRTTMEKVKSCLDLLK